MVVHLFSNILVKLENMVDLILTLVKKKVTFYYKKKTKKKKTTTTTTTTATTLTRGPFLVMANKSTKRIFPSQFRVFWTHIFHEFPSYTVTVLHTQDH